MADVVKKILDVGLAIKEAVKTDRTNERWCKGIEKVCGLVHTLQRAQSQWSSHPVDEGTLNSVLDSLKDALALVSRCGKKNAILHVITVKSESLWEEERYSLGHHGEFLQKISLGTLAVTVVTAINLSRS